MAATEQQKEELKEKLRRVMKHFRLALKDAKKIGEPKLIIAGERPDGSGQRVMAFEADEFFADIELLIDAAPDSTQDATEAMAAQFVHKHGLSVHKAG